MAERVAAKGFVNQLEEYLNQKPSREPPLNRGHKIRNFYSGHLNRYHPLTKKSLGQRGDGALCGLKISRNATRFVATAAPGYTATVTDTHISVDCTLNNVGVTLALVASAGAGHQIVIKDAFGRAGLPPLFNVITVAAAVGDTIDRGLFPVTLGAANQSLVLVSDGVTNWEIVI